jgi:hypothetical protein
LADLVESGQLDMMDHGRRKLLIEAAADVVARLHRARISWRSMKAKHFYPEETVPGRWRMWLIDCEGVYTRATRHDCLREWNSFLKSVRSGGSAMQEAFLKAYRAAA